MNRIPAWCADASRLTPGQNFRCAEYIAHASPAAAAYATALLVFLVLCGIAQLRRALGYR